MKFALGLAAAALLAGNPASAAEPQGATPAGDPASDVRAMRMPGSLGSLPRRWDDHRGFVSLFDGKTLKGWDGDPAVWRVEDDAITAVRAATPPRNNDYSSTAAYRRAISTCGSRSASNPAAPAFSTAARPASRGPTAACPARPSPT